MIRRVSPEMVVNGVTGRRLSSAVFQFSSTDEDPYCGMSIDHLALMETAGVDAKAYVSSPPFIGSLTVTVAILRGHALWVGYDPLPQNPYHGGVWHSAGKKKLSKGVARELLRVAEWFVPIDGVAVTDEPPKPNGSAGTKAAST